MSSTVNFITNKSPELVRKSILLAIKRLSQAVHCSLYSVQLPEMKYLLHPQTKCHHSEAGITKKVLSVPSFFYSILSPGTELLPFCTFLLLFLIFTALVQILTPATDFYPSFLQHWRITKNSKIQGSQFWHSHVCAECLKRKVRPGHISVTCPQVQYLGAESFCRHRILSLCWSLIIYTVISAANIKGSPTSL